MVCHFDTRRHNSVCVSTLQNPTPLIRWTLFIFKGVYVCLFHGSSISFDDYLAALDMCNGEGNSNPLQYSCLENPMDRGGWRATVHGVAESRTRLKRLCRHASFLPVFVSEYWFFQWWAARPDLVALLASLGEERFPLCSSIAPYVNLDNNNIYYAIMRIKGVNYEGA